MLNEMLEDFTSTITSNLSTFSTGAIGLVGVLALIDYGLEVMGHAGENPMSIIKMSVRKLLKYTFYVFLIKEFPNLLKILINFFIGIGEELGGSNVGNKPDAIIDTGIEFLTPIAESIKEISSFKDVGLIAPNLLYIFLWIIGFVLVAYIVVQVFMTTVEFYLLGGLSVIFLPFGVYSGTESLVQNTIKVITGVGTRLTVTVTLASLGVSKIKSTAITINQAPGELIPFEDIGKFLIFLAIIAYSIWNAPVLISILLQGGSGAFKAGGVSDTASGMAGAVGGTMGAIKETAGGISDGIGKIGETASNVMSKFSSTESSSSEMTESNTSYFTTSGLGETAGGMIGGIVGEAYAGEEGRIIGEQAGKEIGGKLENSGSDGKSSGLGKSGSNDNNSEKEENDSNKENQEIGSSNIRNETDNSDFSGEQQENTQTKFFADNSDFSSNNQNTNSDNSTGNTATESSSGHNQTSQEERSNNNSNNKYFDTKSGKEPWED